MIHPFDPFMYKHPEFAGQFSQAAGDQVKMAFTFAAFAYILALVLTAFLIFFAIYVIICVDELKTDYKNPIEQCKTMNNLVLPEYLVHLSFNILFLFAMQFGSLAWNMPLIAYHVYRYANRPVMSGPGLYDPTTIMNGDEMTRVMREGWAKLGFYLLSFFYYLYSMIYVLVTATS
jgi:hypothetical protein